MAIPPILVQIVGVILLALSIRSIVKHYNKESKEAKEAPNQSNVERILNTAILYVWFVFTLLFTIGMIINNRSF